MASDCLFCKIANKEMDTELLMETDDLVVFKDINPLAPVHLLFVPKRHIRSINDLEETDAPILSELIFAARDMAAKTGVSTTGYRLFFNVEKGGGQEIFHLHMHMIGGWES
ncbi:MAG: histidine triad nucleotide-binding protein [Desulfosalsimonas sp.]|uniref:histidine triad nucleotide-binding protein n=1 Tax=Desulfosalsimonas sp. TaxID=3073848 RepID=UPI003970C19B